MVIGSCDTWEFTSYICTCRIDVAHIGLFPLWNYENPNPKVFLLLFSITRKIN